MSLGKIFDMTSFSRSVAGSVRAVVGEDCAIHACIQFVAYSFERVVSREWHLECRLH